MSSVAAYWLTPAQAEWARTVGGANLRAVVRLALAGEFGNIKPSAKSEKPGFYVRFSVAGISGVSSAYVRAAIDAYRSQYSRLHPEQDAEIERLTREVNAQMQELERVEYITEEAK